MNKKMTNLEWVKQNLTEKEAETTCCFCKKIYQKTNGKTCSLLCNSCKLNTLGSLLDYLSQEHKEPIKLKQWEFDLIKAHNEDRFSFENFILLKAMKKSGHFKGITDTLMKIGDILDNCEIVHDDYDFGGNENE